MRCAAWARRLLISSLTMALGAIISLCSNRPVITLFFIFELKTVVLLLFHVGTNVGTHFFQVAVLDAKPFGKFLVKFGQFRLRNLVRFKRKLGRLTGNLGAMIVVGEIYFDASLFCSPP